MLAFAEPLLFFTSITPWLTAAISALSAAEILKLGKTPVLDLSPLYEIQSLEYVSPYATNVTRQEVKKLHKALPDCDIRSEYGFD